MRISGGAARGVPLQVPKGDAVRPATDGLRQAVFSSLAARVPGARFADLPPAATKAKNYAAWQKDFGTWLYQTQKLSILRSPATGLTSNAGESERDFRTRLQQGAREQRDAVAETLRQKYAPKLAALQERLRRAQQAVERQQAEAALQRSERRYRELVEHSLGLICAHDVDGHLLFVNPAAARSLGYAPDDWVGRNLRDFVPAEAHLLYEDYLRRINARNVDSGLMRVLDRQGRERVWMYHNVRYEQTGEAPYIVGHALDITERVLAEQAIRRNREDLKKAYRQLDERVRQRTAEFEAANEQLRNEIAERRRAETMRETAMVRELDTLAFLATAGDQLTRALDHDATLATLARLTVPFLADWTTLHAVGDDGAWRILGGRSHDPAHKALFAQLVSLPPHALDSDSRIAQAARTRETLVLGDGDGPLASTIFGRGLHLPCDHASRHRRVHRAGAGRRVARAGRAAGARINGCLG